MSHSAQSVWSRIPWHVFAVLTFVLPALGIVVTRQFVLHGGPRVAHANSDDILPLMKGDESLQETAAATQIAKADAALASIYNERASMKVTRSPVAASLRGPRHMQVDIPLEMPAPIDPDTQPTTTSLMPESVSVTSILAAPTGNRAVVGGRLRSVGDRITQGWRITAIDPDSGSVTCVHETGETALLRIKRPGRPRDAQLEPQEP